MSLGVWAGAAVLIFAGLVRLPHYDISWFGNDQINFVAEGRRILAGDWNVVGPRAAGFNIVGPLYSFMLAGLLWIGKDAAFLAFINAVCEVTAAWLVYDTARRLSGVAAGVTAGVLYASAPILMISTRLIWNPSLLPAAVALGCWLVVRYVERPSTWRLVAVALMSGLTTTLHATGIFPSVAWGLIVLLTKRLSLQQMAAAVVAGLLPLTPILLRLLSGTSQASADRPPLGTNDVLETLTGIGAMMVNFPVSAYREHWSALPSAIVLRIDAVVTIVGLAIGLARKGPYRTVWLGLAAALGVHLVGAILYSGPLAWYYFSGAVPIVCLSVGSGVGAWPRLRVGAAALIVCLAMAHVVFVQAFDRRAIELGFIPVRGDGLVLRLPPPPANASPNHGITLREVKNTANALIDTLPDAVTAMRASHGVRAELWRETGAEFMPFVQGRGDEWASEFVLMGNGATVLHQGARLVGDRVCVFDRPTRASWKVQRDDVPGEWVLPAFADEGWYPLPLPRRMVGSLGPGPGFWRSPRQSIRGRVRVDQPNGQHLYVVAVHSGNSQHWITRFAVNGTDIGPTKSRLIPSSVFRNEEWLFDLSGRLQQGENLIAVGLDGQTQAFDVDVFELPCLDREWYNTDR